MGKNRILPNGHHTPTDNRAASLVGVDENLRTGAWKKRASAPAHRSRQVASKYTEGPNPSAVTLQRPCHCEIR
jgi:hypothetical protein